MQHSKKIALNSFILYARLGLVTIIKLFVTRLMIKNLGVDSFGLYNLLAGIIVMLSFLQAALSNASQRFLSVSMGKNDGTTKEIFYSSYVLHFLAGLIGLLLIVVVGIPLVEWILNIPVGQKDIAFKLIIILGFTTFLTILSVPYDSIMMAKEDIPELSIFIISESLVMLVAAYAVAYLDNKLIWFSLIILFGHLLLFFLRKVVCNHKYVESRFNFHRLNDTTIIRSIVKYASFNAVSSLFVIVRNQGFAVVFNLVGGVVVNAAYGVANQVNALFNYCSEALMQPVRPVIMKAYGSGDVKKALKITIFSEKIILLVTTIILSILFFNIETLMHLWLTEIPKYSVALCRIIIISTFMFQFSTAHKVLKEATGDVKGLYMNIGYFHLCSLILGIILIVATKNVIIAALPFIIEEGFDSIYRIHLTREIYRSNHIPFIFETITKPLIILFIIGLINFILLSIISKAFIYIVVSTISTVLTTSILYYIVVFKPLERERLIQVVCKK